MINTLPKSLIDTARLILESSKHPMIDVDGVMKHRHNSEGKPIHHTDDGIRNFHKWFGDSKAVDEHGRPQVMYHGTIESNVEPRRKFKATTGVTWVSPDKHIASKYAGHQGNVYPVYVKSHTPFSTRHLISSDANDDGSTASKLGLKSALTTQSPNKNQDALAELHDRVSISQSTADAWKTPNSATAFSKLGFDSIHHRQNGSNTIGVFNTSQIKTAIGNNGKFSKGNINLHESVDHPMIDVDGVMKHRYNSNDIPIHHTDEGIRNFHRWFGDSKAVDDQGRPKVFYHGTRNSFDEFSNDKLGSTTGAASATMGHFFADRKRTAESYTNIVKPEEAEEHDTLFDTAKKLYKSWSMSSSIDPKRKAVATQKYNDANVLYKQAHQLRTSGGNVMPVYLKMNNPHIHDQQGKTYRDTLYSDVLTHAKEKGHDSFVIKNTYDQVLGDGLPDNIHGVFHPSQIKSAIGNDGTFDHPTKITESVSDYPKTAIIGRLKDAVDSGRYDIAHHEEDDNYHHFHAVPKKSDNAIEFKEREGKHPSWYDPEIAHVHTPHPEDPFPRTYARLNPNSGYHAEPQDTKQAGVIYRGMSHEEFQNIKKTGKISSRGEYNLEGQEHLTYYSKSPSQAQSYSHSFAPTQFKASGKHNAYIVAVKDPGTDVKITGTGEDEVGIPHPIDAKDILHVHVGRAYSGSPGSYSIHKGWNGLEESSSTTPQAYVGWKKMSFEEASK